MQILITGTSGFVGSAVLRRLVREGHNVRALVRPTSDLRNLERQDAKPVVGDLASPESLAPALSGCDGLFHVAADYRLWVPEPSGMYDVNVNGTRQLMTAALEAGVRRIVYTSSVATLGFEADGSPADEETPVALDDMIGHYKRSKFLAEAEVQRLVTEANLPAVIVNPSTPVGPRDIKPTPTGRMVLDAAAGRMPAYVDTGLNIVHVGDVADGHLLAFEKGVIGRRYVLGGENLTLKDIFEEISAITGRPPPRVQLPHNLVMPIAYLLEGWARLFGGGEPRVTVDGVRLAKKRMFFTSARAKTELGYKHRPVGDAFRDAVAWFKGQGYF